MNEIGGYFELELRKGNEYHRDAIALNTGRNALELILITKKYTKVYIPCFTCDVILEPFKKHNIAVEFYHINLDFEPLFDFKKIKKSEGFLYTNYFGIKDIYLKKIAALCLNLIIDNTQSFFSKPIPTIPTFYSCRKFFGVPDGSYLYLDEVVDIDLAVDHSEKRFSHLLKRIEFEGKGGYKEFKENDYNLIGQPILQMSKLTKALLCNIDYDFIKAKRIENFLFLHKHLSNKNQLNINIDADSIPLVYPFRTRQSGIKQKLIDNKIYIATYWPNVNDWCEENKFEYLLTNEILHLPVDQRYKEEQMKFIIKQLI